MEARSDFIRKTEGTRPSKADLHAAKDAARDHGYRKAAQFLILIGEDQAAKVLRHLSEEEVEGITREIAAIDRITEAEAEKVLEEFGYLVRTRRLTPQGGIEKARELLQAALGPERGGELFDRVRRRIGPNFRFLRGVDPHQAAALLREESPAVTAAVLTQIEAQQAARILSCFGREEQREIAARIARMTSLSTDVMEKVRASLEGRLRAEGRIVTRGVHGRSVLAAIARHLEPDARESLLGALAESDPELAASVEERLFGPEMVLEMDRKELSRVLARITDRQVALVARAAGPAVREALLAAVSSRRRKLVASEEELLGEPSPAELGQALRDFADAARGARREELPARTGRERG